MFQKQVFIEILKHLKTNENNLYEISYDRIFELLYDYDYEYYEEFKNNLKKFNKFNGNLFIAILEDDEGIYHKFLDNVFDFLKIDDLFKKSKNSTGITDSWGIDLSLDEITDKNILIIINKKFIKFSQNWKDTLEHELTHFIKRIVGYDKSLTKNFKYVGNNSLIEHNEKIKEFINEIIEKSTLNKNAIKSGLNRFISYIIDPIEHDENIKSCLNCLQRIYEF